MGQNPNKLAGVADYLRKNLGYDTIEIKGLRGAHKDTAISCAKTDHNPELRTSVKLTARDKFGRFIKL